MPDATFNQNVVHMDFVKFLYDLKEWISYFKLTSIVATAKTLFSIIEEIYNIL